MFRVRLHYHHYAGWDCSIDTNCIASGGGSMFLTITPRPSKFWPPRLNRIHPQVFNFDLCIHSLMHAASNAALIDTNCIASGGGSTFLKICPRPSKFWPPRLDRLHSQVFNFDFCIHSSSTFRLRLHHHQHAGSGCIIINVHVQVRYHQRAGSDCIIIKVAVAIA